MRLSATSGGSDWTPLPAGQYRAVITGFIHLGTQVGGLFGPKNQAMVIFTAFDEEDDKLVETRDGEPWTISKFYTLSFNVKAGLRADVETMSGIKYGDGDTFDPAMLKHMQARITVVNEEKMTPQCKRLKAKIAKVESCSKRDKIQPQVVAALPWLYFEITGTNCPIPPEVGDWAIKAIQSSPEWSGTAMPSAPTAKPPFDEFANELHERVASR